MERGFRSVEIKLFKELPIGQVFRLARRSDMELVKIAPIGTGRLTGSSAKRK